MNHFLTKIKAYQSTFSDGDKQILTYILDHQDSISNSSIHDLAGQIGISSATLSRFTKKIGYASFQDFKLAAYQATTASKTQDQTFFGNISPENNNKEILDTVFYNTINSLKSTCEIIDNNALDQAINIISSSQSCSFFGLGGSNTVAAIAYHKFLRTSLSTNYHADFHYQQMIASTLTENDCAIVISHSGQNIDTLKIVDILKHRNVPIIGITSYHGSLLDKQSTVSFISISDEISFRPEAVSSTVSQISIIDALFMIYGMRHQDKLSPAISAIRETIQNTRSK